jgi:hypothetical protein
MRELQNCKCESRSGTLVCETTTAIHTSQANFPYRSDEAQSPQPIENSISKLGSYNLLSKKKILKNALQKQKQQHEILAIQLKCKPFFI